MSRSQTPKIHVYDCHPDLGKNISFTQEALSSLLSYTTAIFAVELQTRSK
ncbi:hypothetical protein DSUL_80056 [Desulfovibrionales bacterium]